MSDEEREFIKKVNVDKAKNKMIEPIIIMIVSILTYVVPLLGGYFDFGIIFEVISFIFLLIARYYIAKYDEIRAKRYIVCSMLPVVWLLIYDFIFNCSFAKNVIELVILIYNYLFGEMILIGYLAELLRINRDLAKANNPIKYKESTDWFYERYEEKENEKNENILR